jgi:hypothetical protein
VKRDERTRAWLVWAHQHPSIEQTLTNIQTARETFLSKTDLRYRQVEIRCDERHFKSRSISEKAGYRSPTA